MARLLILLFGDVRRDPRVRRQLLALSPHHEITVASFGAGIGGPWTHVTLDERLASTGGFTRVHSALRLLTGRYEAAYWSRPLVQHARAILERVQADAVLANDLETLPLALELAPGRVLYDAHEYKPLEFEDRLRFRLFQRYYWALWRHYVPKACRVTTVSPGLAAKFASDIGVEASVITNAAPYASVPAARRDQDAAIRLVHHGYAILSRRIERMIESVQRLDERFTLDLMLVDSTPGYLDHLRTLASGDARIRFRDPVEPDGIVAATTTYDVGLFLLEPANFNYRHALPNKLFEFVQARLAVAVGPSPDMAAFVREYGVGVVADDFTAAAMARALAGLTRAQVEEFRRASDRAAPVVAAEHNHVRWQEEINRVLEG